MRAGKLDVVAPVTAGDLLLIQNASGISIDGLSFQHTDWDGKHAFKMSGGVQSASFLDAAAVHLKNASNCTLSQIEVLHTGQYGVWFNDCGANNKMVSSTVMDLGAGGVRIGTGGPLPDDPEFTSNNTVTDCVIKDGSHVFAEGVGILLQHSSFNTISHNEVGNFKYTGISVGWNWDYHPTQAHSNIIEWNHVHAVGQGELSDLAGIYLLGRSPGTVIRSNRVHGARAFYKWGHGIYADQACSDVLITGNVVYDTMHAGAYQHFGARNLWTQNIFALAYGGFGQLYEAEFSPDQFGNSNLTFSQNIVYLDSRAGRVFACPYAGSWTAGKNMFFNASNPHGALSNTFPNPADVAVGAVKSDNNCNTSFADWQAAGVDSDSVLADPLFADSRKGNFTLGQDSPAVLQIGFDIANTNAVMLTAGPHLQTAMLATPVEALSLYV